MPVTLYSRVAMNVESVVLIVIVFNCVFSPVKSWLLITLIICLKGYKPLGMTQCQDEFRIPSGRTQKLKVTKWCWKQRNEHNLMYIYHKQCENKQKIQ